MARTMTEITESIGKTELLCSLCHEKVLVEDARPLNAWVFHIECYGIVIEWIEKHFALTAKT